MNLIIFLFGHFLGGLKIFTYCSLAVSVEDIVHLLAADQYLQEQDNKKYKFYKRCYNLNAG
jgi:hypothetical protein